MANLAEDRMAKLLMAALFGNLTGAENILKEGIDVNQLYTFPGSVSRAMLKQELRTVANAPESTSLDSLNGQLQFVLDDLEGKDYSPLHMACTHDRPAIVEMLLKYGADPNIKTQTGRVPLMDALINSWAHKKQNKQSKQMNIEILIKNGADPNCTVILDEPLMNVAALFNLAEDMEYLYKYGANLEVQSKHKATPLIKASYNCAFEATRFLLEHGVDINHQDERGYTALHYHCTARYSHNHQHIQFLLEKHPDLSFRSLNGMTPLHVACNHGNEAAIHLLLKHGADPDVMDLAGRSPLFHLLSSNAFPRVIYGLELILHWTMHLNIFDSEGNIPVWLNHDEFKKGRKKFEVQSRTPSSLKHIARLLIRRCIGMNNLNLKSVGLLPCGKGLQNLVLFNMAEYWWQ